MVQEVGKPTQNFVLLVAMGAVASSCDSNEEQEYVSHMRRLCEWRPNSAGSCLGDRKS